MKKIFAILFLIFIFIFIAILFKPEQHDLKIVKVKSANEFYVDFNKNKKPDNDELVEMYAVRSFIKGVKTPYTSNIESAKLEYLADEFAKKQLLNKKVTLKFDGKKRLITIYLNNQDYAELLLKKGLALVNEAFKESGYKNPDMEIIKMRLKEADKLNLTAYNPYSKKLHKLDCKFANLNRNIILIPLSEIKTETKKCNYCYATKRAEKFTKYPKIEFEKYNPVYSDKFIEMYINDFTKYYYPSDKCVVTACQSLLRQINNAKSEIDFAIYGIESQPQIINALKKAKQRGVKIRWVYDLDNKTNSSYKDTLPLTKILTDSRADQTSKDAPGKFSNIIMHNKFFIFDNETLWTGSANISGTDMSGFNANTVLLIKSKDIAKIYKQEFEQMYKGYFHKKKSKLNNPEFISLQQSKVSVYFSPQDKIIENKIIPYIKNAKKYIYIPVFVITHKSLITELMLAKQRGVDVRIISDATGASNKYSPIKLIRTAGIKVKTENRAGKMHMKSILIDDKYTIIGSMNFSKSGEAYNDENVIIIENTKLTENFKRQFLYLWSAIPEKWLYKNPQAESYDSINSCFDGVDNDHDGYIDSNDKSCKYFVK